MQIAFIGFGEAGSAIASGWEPDRHSVAAYDIKTEAQATVVDIRARCAEHGVICCATLAEALAGAELVFSTVTADQAVVAATQAAAHLPRDAFFCDLNSCAPSSKRRAEAIIAGVGARYVDVAVMAPVWPKRNMVPLLISGPHAAAACPVLTSLPMAPRVVTGAVGRASAIKMIRSVMVKGLEALTAECVLAAVAAGVEDEVLPSLLHGHPHMDVAAAAAYNFERSMAHGERRAAEMEEVAKTLADLGLPSGMSAATVHWQRAIAAAARAGADVENADGIQEIAAQLLPSIRRPPG
ncbi:NAD(P)-dependent oxidoreductase [Algicella marina]|uniref:NAD(P)-dependent oxidoreductase n=1 Tax=Algicella marina TaxID=2683284 RepID=UPI001379BC22|nr:NAD(P)-dependent oxidoreductase [Algicella marina]